MILLDSESSTSIFSNPSYVKDIHETAEMLKLVTNGGKLFTNLKATVPGFGLVWYAPKSMTNIFSLAEMEEKHRVT
jgi:predicted enzyme related to lactoylglutathione lyase